MNEIEYPQSLDIRFWIDDDAYSLSFDINEKWANGDEWKDRNIEFNFDEFELTDICNENNDDDESSAYTLVYFNKKKEK